MEVLDTGYMVSIPTIPTITLEEEIGSTKNIEPLKWKNQFYQKSHNILESSSSTQLAENLFQSALPGVLEQRHRIKSSHFALVQDANPV